MGIRDATVVQLGNEGIKTVDNLVDFDKDTIQQVSDSLLCPGSRILYPPPNAEAGTTIQTPPFVFRENPQKRLLAACDIVGYYDTTRQGISTANI